MNRFRRQATQEEPTVDPSVVAVAVPGPSGAAMAAFRAAGGRAELLAEAADAGADAARAFAAARRAGRTVVALAGADVIVRGVQLPAADEDRLATALRLNATTFVLGRTPSWRVASSMLPRERGDGIRTGIVAEWPVEAAAPWQSGGRGGPEVTFAPAVAGLAALAAAADGPLAWIDPSDGVVSICIPTSRGLLIRSFRAGTEDGAVRAGDVSLAVGEACVHAGVPGSEIPATIASAADAVAPVLSGGFGCVPADLRRIAPLAPGTPDDPQWWRRHGLAVGLAVAAAGPLVPLTELRDRDPGATPDRAGAILNRLAEPATSRRILAAGLAAVLLGPIALEGGRLLLLRWKLADLDGYVRAEDEDRRRQTMYRALSRQGASMTKTLSDIACCAPDGVEIEFINVAPSATGQAVTIRGKSRAAGSTSATEVLMEMERQMRESGAFDGIQRSSDPPDSRGYQEFSLGATAIRPTYLVAYPEAQDFAKTSMRERRYGPPPEDVDPVASGLEPGSAPTEPSDQPGDGGTRGRGSAGASSTAKRTSSETDRGGTRESPTATPSVTAAADADAPAAGSGAKEPAKPAAKDAGAEPAPAARAEGAGEDDEESGRGRERGGRGSRGSSGRRGGLATRSNPGAGAEPDPVPPALTENEIDRMSPEERRTTLAAVAKARQRADLDEETKSRLKREFDMLLEKGRSPK